MPTAFGAVQYQDGGSEYPKGAHRFLQEVDCVRCDAYVHVLRARQDRGHVVKIIDILSADLLCSPMLSFTL